MTKQLLKIFGAIVLGFIVYRLNIPGLEHPAMIYLGAFAFMIASMTMKALPDYLSALLAISACFCFKVDKFDVVFSGFAGSTVWMVIAILGFAAAVTKSGLINRIAFSVLKYFPGTYRGQVLAMMAASAVICPLIPSILGKIAIMGPFAASVAKESGFEKGSKASAGLFSAMFIAANNLGIAFLTGSTASFILLGMLPDALRPQFSWTYWFMGGIVWFTVSFALTYFFIIKYFKPESGFSLPENFAKEKAEKLGPMSIAEKFSAILLGLFIILLMTSNLHHIDAYIISILALTAMVIFGLFEEKDVMMKIPWPLVILIGSILGIATMLATTGVSKWIVVSMGPALGPLAANVWVLVCVVAIATYALRFVIISFVASTTVMFAIFAPVAESVNISPWIILFVAFASCQVWNLSFHNITFLQAEACTGGQMITCKSTLPMSLAYMVISLLACLASIPAWQMLGLIK